VGVNRRFSTGLAHFYNLVPYQRRAQHAGQCGVEVEGGRVPTPDWMLNLQILTLNLSRFVVVSCDYPPPRASSSADWQD